MIVKELEIKLPQINNLIKTAENKSQSAEKEVRDAEYSSGNGLYSVMETQKNIVNYTTKVSHKLSLYECVSFQISKAVNFFSVIILNQFEHYITFMTYCLINLLFKCNLEKKNF